MKLRPHLLPCIVAAVAALFAIAYLPYDYYALIRWLVCMTSIYVIVLAVTYRQLWAIAAFGVIALLFNPISPIHLTRQIWRPLDLSAALALTIAGYTLAPRRADGLISRNPAKIREAVVYAVSLLLGLSWFVGVIAWVLNLGPWVLVAFCFLIALWMVLKWVLLRKLPSE